MSQRPLGFAAATVLKALVGGCRYGFDIIDATGLGSSAVYPTLARLEELRYIASRWEDASIAQREKRPPRRYYEVRAAGLRALEAALERYRALDMPASRLRPRKSTRS